MKKFLGLTLALVSLTGCSSYTLVNSDVYNNADLSACHTFRIVTPADGAMPPGMTMVTYYNIAAAIREQLVERGFVEDQNSPILVNIGLTVKEGIAYQTITNPGVWVSTPPPPPPAPYPMPQPQRPDAQQLQSGELPGGGGPGLVAPPEGSGLQFNQYAPVEQQNNPPALPPSGYRHMPPPGPPHNGMVPFFMYPRSYYLPGTTQIVPSVYREGVLTMDIVNMNTKMPLYSSSVATILDNGDTQFRNLSGIAEAVKVLFSKFPVPLLPQYK